MTETTLQRIALDKIMPDPNQPRAIAPTLAELMDAARQGDGKAQTMLDKLQKLAASILEVGLKQPISVYSHEANYIILDGHRRWLAVGLLQQQGHGDGTIECYIQAQPQTEEDTLLSQLLVNMQREDLNVFELARSCERLKASLQANGGMVRLVREDGSLETMTLHPQQNDDEVWAAIEHKLGIARSRRYQIQAVLKLPANIQSMAEKANIPEGRLRYLIPLKEEAIQETILQEIIQFNLSNADIKRRIKELLREHEIASHVLMPKPMRIKSAIKPISKLRQEIEAIKNIQAAVVAKDPRTVASYQTLLPELQEAITDLQLILSKLNFLQDNQ